METTGKLEHQSVLLIHTRQAKQLVVENKRSQSTENKKAYLIVGLEKFGASLNTLWHRVRIDDPYAEMALIEIERRINNAFKLLDKLHNTIDSQLQIELPGITLTFYQSDDPAIVHLNTALFTTTHALLGARLIGLYDLLIRKLHTSQQFGIINRHQSSRYQYQSAKALRGVFSAPLLYKSLGVKRSDILQKTEKGIAAMEQLGEIPLAILTQTNQSMYGPRPAVIETNIL